MKWIPLAALLLSGCAVPVASPSPVASCPVGDPAVTAQLLFGRSIKGGGRVSDAAWRDFLARSVTPRFPDGLTVLNGYGQWRENGTDRVVREDSTLVEIVTDGTPETLAKLQAIRDAYRTAFQQDSVGLVLNESCASF